MKTRHSLFLGLALLSASMVTAQESGEEGREIFLRTPEQLDELLGPVALYPDALIALILPASTEPTDVVLAARFLDSGGDPDKIDHQPWDESARALARFPDVVQWMDENLTWTIQVGDAFLAQPAEVMKSIQRLRAKARAAGTLVDTRQQQVVVENEYIRIVPAEPEIIYVPYYDPQVVYVSRPHYVVEDPFIRFGLGFRFGSWLTYDCDWYNHRIWYFDRHHHHRSYHEWRHPRPYVHDPRFQPWQPSPTRRFHPRPPDHHRAPPPVVRPRPHRDYADGESSVPGSRDRRDGPEMTPERERSAAEARRDRRGTVRPLPPAPTHSFEASPGPAPARVERTNPPAEVPAHLRRSRTLPVRQPGAATAPAAPVMVQPPPSSATRTLTRTPAAPAPAAATVSSPQPAARVESRPETAPPPAKPAPSIPSHLRRSRVDRNEN